MWNDTINMDDSIYSEESKFMDAYQFRVDVVDPHVSASLNRIVY